MKRPSGSNDITDFPLFKWAEENGLFVQVRLRPYTGDFIADLQDCYQAVGMYIGSLYEVGSTPRDAVRELQSVVSYKQIYHLPTKKQRDAPRFVYPRDYLDDLARERGDYLKSFQPPPLNPDRPLWRPKAQAGATP